MTIREIALAGIEDHASWIKYSAASIARYVKMLTYQPPFETRAEAAIEEAEKELAAALLVVAEMKDLYRLLPREEDNNHV